MSLVVTDFPSCGWPIHSIVGTNSFFLEWVQIFQKNSFWGEPILGGSKLNMTDTQWSPDTSPCERVGSGHKTRYNPELLLGDYLLHIRFSSPARMLFWDPLRWPLLHILSISRSVSIDAADLHVDLLLSEQQNS